jgi:hypothetical protein
MTVRPERIVFLPLSPRSLSREHAATYCGCESLSAFDDWVRRALIPSPMRGTHWLDRRAINLALDRLSGLENDDDDTINLGEWMRRHGEQGHKDDTALTIDEWEAQQKRRR